jgi:hypothetical protein
MLTAGNRLIIAQRLNSDMYTRVGLLEFCVHVGRRLNLSQLRIGGLEKLPELLTLPGPATAV